MSKEYADEDGIKIGGEIGRAFGGGERDGYGVVELGT